MNQLGMLTVGGIASGAVYAALGLSLVIIFRATRVVNFAQPVLALLSTYLAFTVNQATGAYWLGFAVAIVAGAVLGALSDRLLIRPARGPEHARGHPSRGRLGISRAGCRAPVDASDLFA
ncbi:MAG: hypothetical protein GEV28_27630 [Actinophytocola sp.]|uniref:ABC transporter permease subunit n=1 Tax=Actinophytocola sp. TaxID=1872138 RepID=UPI00132364B8|nr:hypothetical protein [Actinophytocola sp.]MPZ83960.1 hypothetical protein [Actinophytocola sp.]